VCPLWYVGADVGADAQAADKASWLQLILRIYYCETSIGTTRWTMTSVSVFLALLPALCLFFAQSSYTSIRSISFAGSVF